jgi:hypothetical protein
MRLLALLATAFPIGFVSAVQRVVDLGYVKYAGRIVGVGTTQD